MEAGLTSCRPRWKILYSIGSSFLVGSHHVMADCETCGQLSSRPEEKMPGQWLVLEYGRENSTCMLI